MRGNQDLNATSPTISLNSGIQTVTCQLLDQEVFVNPAIEGQVTVGKDDMEIGWQKIYRSDFLSCRLYSRTG
jgi:hypothetical protein